MHTRRKSNRNRFHPYPAVKRTSNSAKHIPVTAERNGSDSLRSPVVPPEFVDRTPSLGASGSAGFHSEKMSNDDHRQTTRHQRKYFVLHPSSSEFGEYKVPSPWREVTAETTKCALQFVQHKGDLKDIILLLQHALLQQQQYSVDLQNDVSTVNAMLASERYEREMAEDKLNVAEQRAEKERRTRDALSQHLKKQTEDNAQLRAERDMLAKRQIQGMNDAAKLAHAEHKLRDQERQFHLRCAFLQAHFEEQLTSYRRSASVSCDCADVKMEDEPGCVDDESPVQNETTTIPVPSSDSTGTPLSPSYDSQSSAPPESFAENQNSSGPPFDESSANPSSPLAQPASPNPLDNCDIFESPPMPQSDDDWISLYETRWDQLSRYLTQSKHQTQPRQLTFSHFPWPAFLFVDCWGDLEESDVRAFFETRLPSDGPDILYKQELLRWHPDKLARLSKVISPGDLDEINKGFSLCIMVINELRDLRQ